MFETKFVVDAILFDMDGTLIDSTGGVLGAWEYWGQKNPHLNIEEILQTCHGVRTIDNLRKWCPEIPPEKLQDAVNEFELEIVRAAKRNEAAGKTGLILLPGVTELLQSLRDDDWAICTSATRVYGAAALEAVGIPPPKAFVTADDVTRGKPYPDPYLMGAEKCGVDVRRCIVVEDAPSGVKSGKAAGAKVLAVCTSHTKEQMQATEPDVLVQDLSCVTIEHIAEGIEITISVS
ncbi:hypothetical protein FRB99_001305 [Tulasnella sp. 403]|nr:hypothetical protein FRB99_001305 [Tulasnella sp. 403]